MRGVPELSTAGSNLYPPDSNPSFIFNFKTVRLFKFEMVVSSSLAQLKFMKYGLTSHNSLNAFLKIRFDQLSNRPQRQSESYYKKASSLSYQPRQPKTSLQQDIHRRRFGSEIGLQGLGWTVSDAEFGSLGADQRRDSINTLYGDFRNKNAD